MLTQFHKFRLHPDFSKAPSVDSQMATTCARDLEQQGHVETAVQLYALLGEQSREARDRLNAISGKGGLSSQRFEVLAGQFTGQVTDPAALFAMAGAQGTYRLVSAGLGKILGFAAEAGLFPIYHRFGDAALGRRTDWSSRALRNDTVGSFAVLGGLRLFAGLSRQAFQWGEGSRSWLPLYEQAGQYGGIVLGHCTETQLLSWIDPKFYSPNYGMGQTLVESLVTLIHFNGMGRILGPAGFPNPIQRMDAWMPPGRYLNLAYGFPGRGMGPRNSEDSTPLVSHQVFSHGGGKIGRNSPAGIRLRYADYWNRMAEKLAEHPGSITAAIEDLGIPVGTFYYRLNLALKHALPDMAIHPWAQRLSGEGREAELAQRFQRVAEALDGSRGNISQAAKHLGVTTPAIYNALRRGLRDAPESADIRKWTSLLTPQGRTERKRRRGLDYTLALVGSGGDIKAASQQLGITPGTLSRFLEMIISPKGDGEYGPFYRRVMMENIARVRPGDNRLLHALEFSPSEATRYFLTQFIISSHRRVVPVMERVADQDPSPLVRLGARQALDLSKEDRILLSFGTRNRKISTLGLIRQTGIERKVLATRLGALGRRALVLRDEDGLYRLGPLGRTKAEQVRRERIWDNLDLALELRHGYQKKAAQLLGVNSRTFRRFLHASIGYQTADSGRAEAYRDPAWVAPPEHSIHRWNHPEYYEHVRREQMKATRIPLYQAAWEKIREALERTKGDYDQVALELNLSNTRLLEYLRLAHAYDWKSLLDWAQPQRYQEYRELKSKERIQHIYDKTRIKNQAWWERHSRFQRVRTNNLPISKPYRDVPDEVKTELVIRHQWGDGMAGKLLEKVYRKWVYYWGRRYKNMGVSTEDLYHSGIRGVFEAAKRFDASVGAKFQSYAWYYMTNYQVRQVRRALSTHFSPENYRLYRQMMNLVKQAKTQGQDVDPEAIANELQVSLNKLEELRLTVRGQFKKSWEGKAGGEEGRSLQEVVPDRRANVAHEVLQNQVRDSLTLFLQSYPKKGRRILPFEVFTAENERLVEIAEEIGMEFHHLLTERETMRQELQDFLRERDIEADFFE